MASLHHTMRILRIMGTGFQNYLVSTIMVSKLPWEQLKPDTLRAISLFPVWIQFLARKGCLSDLHTIPSINWAVR